MRTYSPKPGDVQRQWLVIDATDVVLGRLATQAATLLRGKHKPIYAPHVDTGDFVIIINADKVALTGNKRETKIAYRHSGLSRAACAPRPTADLLEKHPEQGRREGRQGDAPAQHPRPGDAVASSRCTPGPSTRTRRRRRPPFEITQVAQ